MNKKQFLSRPSIRGLSKQQKEARWKQHLASKSVKLPQQQPPQQKNVTKIHKPLTPEQQCAKNYASALLNPFALQPSCMPWTPALASRKVSNFVRDTMVVGTGGIGYVLARPFAASDDDAVFRSSILYAGTVADINPAVPGVVAARTNSEYRIADFTGDLIQVRLTAFGIRLRYTGTVLNRNGSVVALEEPNHATLNLSTYQDIRAFDKAASVYTPDGKWVSAVHQPAKNQDYEFHNAAEFGYNNNYYLTLVVSADPGTVFEYEYFVHYEAVGSNVRGKTASYSNINDTSRAISTISQMSTQAIDRASITPGQAVEMAEKVLGYGKTAYEWGSAAVAIGSMFA